MHWVLMEGDWLQIEDAWSHVRVFGAIMKWFPAVGGVELKSELLVLPHCCCTQLHIGSCIID